MKTKYTLLVIISWFFTVSLLAQTVNESVVVSSGGGPSAGGIYSNFAVVGEPFVASPVSGSTISTNIGFIYRTADIQATIVNLTIFLEGLYAGAGMMNKAQNEFGDQFSGTVADKITFELHNAITYATTAYTNSNVDLNTNGTATVSVPSGVSGSYYVTVKHRNSVETVSKDPLSFAGSPLSYNFTSALSQAFGNNLKPLSGGVYGLYAGDITGDGAVDALDMIPLENNAASFVMGYINTDVNGDGSIDALDMILVDNNSAAFISAITP